MAGGSHEHDFYVRYYVGHKGKFGHEFLEFEVTKGMVRPARVWEHVMDVAVDLSVWV